jgi:hypothetical protein
MFSIEYVVRFAVVVVIHCVVVIVQLLPEAKYEMILKTMTTLTTFLIVVRFAVVVVIHCVVVIVQLLPEVKK